MELESLIAFWEKVRRGSLSTLERFEEDELDWSPIDGGYTIRGICLHLAHEEAIEIAHGIARLPPELPEAFPPDDYPTKASIRDLWTSVHARTLAALGGLGPGGLEGPLELAWGETARPVDVLLHVIEHEIHHRGELSLALGLLGREGLDA